MHDTRISCIAFHASKLIVQQFARSQQLPEAVIMQGFMDDGYVLLFVNITACKFNHIVFDQVN